MDSVQNGSLTSLHGRPRAASPVVDQLSLHEMADYFKLLGEPTRWRLLLRLYGGSALGVAETVKCFGLLQPALSQHLCRLRLAGLVEFERRGQRSYYRLTVRGRYVVEKVAWGLVKYLAEPP